MDQFWEELGKDIPETGRLLTITMRLLLAAIVGAMPGLQREMKGTPAGLRTHMLVALGSAVFVMAAIDAGAAIDDVSRVIQGLAAGIGFVGAGAILKSPQTKEVRGLTTAANIWLTAGLGTAAGLGRVWLAVIGSVLSVLVLAVIKRVAPDDPDPDRYPPREN